MIEFPMKTLVLISANFPYGTREPFLETEFPFLYREFDKIIIVSLNETSREKRKIPENVILLNYKTSTSLSGYLYLPFLFFKNISLAIEMFRKEIRFRNKKGQPLSGKQKMFLWKKIIKAIQLKDFISSKLKHLHISSDMVFYSYWLNIGAYALCMLRYNRSIKIARAHGSDLYEEKREGYYNPLMRSLAEELDSIFFISEHGKKYFFEKTMSGKALLQVSRLGVIQHEVMVEKSPYMGIFTIVSCSNVIKIKRIDLIIEALGKLGTDRKIRWIHFGDGVLREELEVLARQTLGDCKMISHEFKGYIPNEEVLKFYERNEVNLFLNTSSTEGVPVSIMEAQSFGIPVIATDVGGVSEIVIPGTGFLLPEDFKPQELAEKINCFMAMKAGEEKKFRDNAYSNWKNNFNAAVNYSDFIKRVNRIFDSSIKQIN
jgi:glycosyltransferase involved in cell wall biosynthesis